MGLLWPRIKAAGVIPIVHASGGPLHDIIVPVDGQQTGMCHSLFSSCPLLMHHDVRGRASGDTGACAAMGHIDVF